MTLVSPLLDELASYVPALLVNQLAADTAATMTPAARSFPAAVLFADISGFTALTEYLAQRNPAEAEDLTRWLNKYFETLVNIVTSHGGDVVKFAGDGLLALWYAEDEELPTLTYRALQCGLAVQMTMAPAAWSVFGADREPPVPLKVRVGIGAGPVNVMQLGGVRGRWELLVNGAPLAETGAAESQAAPGDVVMTPRAWALVDQRCAGTTLAGGYVRLDALLDLLPMRALPPLQLTPAIEAALHAYIPQAIRSRMAAGQTAWLAEQRRVTVLFINLPDLSEGAPLEQAQAVMRGLQTALYSFRGSISRLGTDAKGPTVVAAMGLPPVSLEDDAERGVRAALAVVEAMRRLGFRCYIGVTTGQAFCGSVGSLTRREYTMMGPIVNLSARLMQAARTMDLASDEPTPQVICDAATVDAIRGGLAFASLTPIKVKGVAEPVAIYHPLAAGAEPVVGAPTPARTVRASGTLVGREREQRLFSEQLQALVRKQQHGVLIIEGDAGIGKSRLLAALRQQANDLGLQIYNGAGSSIDQLSAYHAWRPVFAGLLGLEGAHPLTAADLERVLAPLNLSPELERFAPLLSALLPVSISETSLVDQMSPQVRARNTRELLLQIIAHTTNRGPLLLIFEDAHWIDSASWSLILSASQLHAPLLIAVALRPLATTISEYQQLLYSPQTRHLRLEGLPAEKIRLLLCQKLAADTISEPVWRFIAARSQGNPFFAEELASALRDRGQLAVVGNVAQLTQNGNGDVAGSPAQILRAMRLPDTVQGLITSRIDQLEPAHQLTLKVASVIGQVFPFDILEAIYPVEGDCSTLRDQLFQLQQLGLLIIVSFEPALVYGFKQHLACEAAYNLMSYAQRRQLHRTLAEYYERTYGSLDLAVRSRELSDTSDYVEQTGDHKDEAQLAPQYALLAYHWRRAAEPARAIGYFERAAEQALAGGAYQEALDFLNEAITLADADAAPSSSGIDLRRARRLRQLGEAHYGLGHLVESREQLERAIALLGMALPTSRSHLALDLGRELSRQLLHRLLPFALIARSRAGSAQLAEAAQAYNLLSRLAYYDSRLATTLHAALRSLNLAEQAGYSPILTQSYANMQIATAALAPISRIYQSRARASARRVGHLPTLAWVAQSEGISYAGMGAWSRAQTAFEQAQAIALRLGDHRRWAENRALLAWVVAFAGNFDHSLQMCEEVYHEGRRHNDAQVQTWGLIGQAETLLARKQTARVTELLNEAERLLAENINSARAEEIWTYGLIALNGLRSGDLPLARYAVNTAGGLMREVPPVALYALLGYAGVAEVYLTMWEQRAYRTYAEQQNLVRSAREACTRMAAFGLIFPIGRPRTLLLEGLYHWLAGRTAPALSRWQRALAMAGQLAMPYEQARAHLELGRHSTGTERREHLAAAAALFARLGMDYGLEQVKTLKH